MVWRLMPVSGTASRRRLSAKSVKPQMTRPQRQRRTKKALVVSFALAALRVRRRGRRQDHRPTSHDAGDRRWHMLAVRRRDPLPPSARRRTSRRRSAGRRCSGGEPGRVVIALLESFARPVTAREYHIAERTCGDGARGPRKRHPNAPRLMRMGAKNGVVDLVELEEIRVRQGLVEVRLAEDRLPAHRGEPRTRR